MLLTNNGVLMGSTQIQREMSQILASKTLTKLTIQTTL